MIERDDKDNHLDSYLHKLLDSSGSSCEDKNEITVKTESPTIFGNEKRSKPTEPSKEEDSDDSSMYLYTVSLYSSAYNDFIDGKDEVLEEYRDEEFSESNESDDFITALKSFLKRESESEQN
ncbi:hypothetical protein CWI38_0071p0050 [Hamiltosporidium tvaerminnensis]|uniref:Uncharacterized protein n=2 Tax=Hamiltosporidium TaxID=1176354 RepID=A0A4Q9LK76_9MICR|nr:hypothetical protein LUQ84_001263 [Hamiltosporidium tvaerminnensis]TBU08035.1 hypothetical protein CWI36_0191p0020 [Hamiltosporidium magnivora]TBU03629.1 hypothetical protein CWI37_0263p0030 [Hamiltosporidium tvaerminnensis]TBU08659.1 hypothetical protein CWI39_0154p0020 [Hamiltosporidium magnivora]TBU08864.1 hypothetical protein CWI36_0090p0070 [Hamiltosporidium magnivora]